MAKHEPHNTRLPGDALPTFEEMLQRIEKLEADPITLRDLPVGELQNKLEQDWQPSPGVLLPPASITNDLLADGTLSPTKLAKREVLGSIDTAGAVTQGSGFTVATHTVGTGIYVVNFTAAFVAAPFVACSPLGGGARIADITARSTSSFTVTWRNDAGVAADTGFTFLAKEI